MAKAGADAADLALAELLLPPNREANGLGIRDAAEAVVPEIVEEPAAGCLAGLGGNGGLVLGPCDDLGGSGRDEE